MAEAHDGPTGVVPAWRRYVQRGLGLALTLVSILWVFGTPSYLGLAVFTEQVLAVVAGIGLAAGYLTLPARRGAERGRVPWYDAGAAVLSVLLMGHVTIAYERLLVDVSQRTDETLVIGVLTTALVMEGVRRAAGWTLFWIVAAFLLYALFADLIPGSMEGRAIPVKQLVIYLALDNNALLGAPLRITTEVVIPFILFGQLLFASGGGRFFTDVAMASVGRRRGGAAKIAVVGSTLFGSISGSSVSNVVATGMITIPLMRRTGYSATVAGAVEAVASTGGQLMPPIMGASAFLMAEFLDIPYTEVMLAAVVPALLYYLALFIQLDLVAARDRVTVVDRDVPDLVDTLIAGWHFLLPFAVLVYALFWMNEDPEIAALYAAAVTAAAALVRGYRDRRVRLRTLVEGVWEAGIVVIELLLILGGASFVIAVLNVTGLGFSLTFALVKLGGASLVLLLVITAMVCIVLGMGMPTLGVYVLLATLIAPGLVEMGIKPLPAHLFILYFGMMSMITPPIAFASFAAATVSGANAWATGWMSMRLAWSAYIIPFLFVLSPTLLLHGDTAHVLLDAATAVAGIYLASAAVVGYFCRPLSPVRRIVLGAAGVAALMPSAVLGELATATVAAGLVIGGAVLGVEYLAARPRRAAEDRV